MACDWGAESFSLMRIFQRRFVCTLRNSETLSCDSDTGIVQCIHGDWESFPWFLEHIFDRDFAILKNEGTGVTAANP